MRVTQIEVKNFRLLKDASIELDKEVTVVVGRNNSGKTSLTEVFYKFFGSDKPYFRFEDFSISTYAEIAKAPDSFVVHQKAVKAGEDEKQLAILESEYISLLPAIKVYIHVEYIDSDDIACLIPFIMDLDPDRKDALICCQYHVKNAERFMKAYDHEEGSFLDYFRDNFRRFYEVRSYAVDKADPKNQSVIENPSTIRNVFLSHFIYAQRNLDDQAIDKSRKLSQTFEDFYRLNKDEKEDVKSIEEVLKQVGIDLDGKYKDLFKDIFADLKTFGVGNGVTLQELILKSLFDPEKVLKGNTQLFYQYEDKLLPESYNGLGYSNLIFIILQFISFYEQFSKRKPQPGFSLLFVEEPEAHLHPQMQYVFIKNINAFLAKKKDWRVQVIITTHSSHIVAESGFESIRYFDNSSSSLVVKNLSDYKKKKTKSDPNGIKFLQQYMSLSNCDMFFADKIIIVEGTVERLLLPRMFKNDHKGLLTKYVSIMEVGGAYAHTFEDLLQFINVKTLVITDIDSVGADGKKCTVDTASAQSSNAVLKKWIPKKDKIAELLKCKDSEKVSGNVRVSFQIPEVAKGKCGRSFEEAFILTNAKHLEDAEGSVMKELFKGKKEADITSDSYGIAEKLQTKKVDFAFDIMLLPTWKTPKYISEGLMWLEQD